MKVLTRETMKQPVEFIISDEPGLQDIYADTRSFSEYWYQDNYPIGSVAVFPNLSGSSLLLTPTPPRKRNQYDFSTDLYKYTSLAPFTRQGDKIQVHTLFRTFGEEALKS